MGTFRVIQLMRFSAVRARSFRHSIAFVFRHLRSIEFQLFAFLAAIDVYRKRTRQQISPRTGEPAKLPQLNLFAAHMGHFPAAAEAGLSIQQPLSFRQKRPLSLRTEGVKIRGTTSGSPLSHKSGLMPCQHTAAQ